MLANIQKILQKDPFLLKDARGVAFPRYWYNLSGNGEVLWGEYRSSKSKCKTTVDLRHEKAAFQCSCRSRKNPCKHGLAMIILLMEYNDAFTVIPELPEEVQSWVKRRDQRILPKNYTEAEEAELAAQRKKVWEKRLQQMAKGLDELEIWLHDTMREGLTTLYQQPKKYWEEWSARLIDTKMKGIATRFKNMPERLKTDDWHESLLAELGDIYLIVKGFRRLGELPTGLQQELFNTIGVNVKKQEVLEREGVEDEWFVLALEEGEEERLLYQRCWLYGIKSKKFALHLDFAWGTEPFAVNWEVGTVAKGEFIFYPSSYPQRGLFRSFQLVKSSFQLEGCADFEILKSTYTQAVGANPWLWSFPVLLEEVIPYIKEDELYLVDVQQKILPCVIHQDLQQWQLFAVSGGRPISVFGIWRVTFFTPLAAQVSERWIDLSLHYERKEARRW